MIIIDALGTESKRFIRELEDGKSEYNLGPFKTQHC